MVSLKTLYIEEGRSHIINIECDIAPGIAGIVFSGRAGRIIEESAIRVRQAIRNVFDISFTQKILINLIPSDVSKNTNLFDLPLAIAILGAINKINFNINNTLILGELSLSGQVLINHSVIPQLLRAKHYGFENCIIPDENIPSTFTIPLDIIKVKDLLQCWEKVNLILKNNKLKNITKYYNLRIQEKIETEKNIYVTKTTFKDNIIYNALNDNNIDYDFSLFKGGFLVKRALAICSAGFHSIYLLGPSGCGKTLLSTMFKYILPPLLKREQYELIDLYSQYNIPFENIYQRPVRNPHHSSTVVSIIGGGSPLSIGEVSLAHNGVLILDEINLFNKKVLESLREPFEEQKVMISRAKYKIILPSSFILFMISNLCYCGNYGSSKRSCSCTEEQRKNFLSYISNALKDRIDIIFYLDDNIYKENIPLDTKTLKSMVLRAFENQFYRFINSEYNFNGKIYKTDTKKFIKLDGDLENYLFDIMKKNGQSFRRMEKVIKVARTIADIENHKDIQKSDLIEAIFYVTGIK